MIHLSKESYSMSEICTLYQETRKELSKNKAIKLAFKRLERIYTQLNKGLKSDQLFYQSIIDSLDEISHEKSSIDLSPLKKRKIEQEYFEFITFTQEAVVNVTKPLRKSFEKTIQMQEVLWNTGKSESFSIETIEKAKTVSKMILMRLLSPSIEKKDQEQEELKIMKEQLDISSFELFQEDRLISKLQEISETSKKISEVFLDKFSKHLAQVQVIEI